MAIPIPSLLLVPCLALLLALPTRSGAAWSFGKPAPVPEGARVTLELDKTQYFLGENVLVHFRLQNVGNVPFSYDYGGDYRGASRSLRFKVTAVGPDGQPATDPDPSGFSEGGLSSEPELKPGESVYFSLPLIRYCRLDAPGQYVLRVKHDLGWTETPERKTPVGEATLTMLLPTPDQARQVIADMDATKPDLGVGWGRKASPYPDFSALRYSVYLPPLRERAKGTDLHAFETAIEGIGSIPTPEATQALLDLSSGPDPKHVLIAAQTLGARLPDPTLSGKLVHRSPFVDPTEGGRRSLNAASWQDSFTPATRALAHRLLRFDDPGGIVCGAFLLECVGTDQDLPALTGALETAIAKTPTEPLVTGYYPRPQGACQELERATLMRIQEGAPAPADPKTPAEQDLYLQALAARPTQRPVDWPRRCLTFLESPISYVRARTLATLDTLMPLPASLSDALRTRLPSLLTNRDEDVQVGACALASKIKDSALRQPVLDALGEARNFPLPNNLTNAAIFQEARWEALKFWADHLDDPDRKQDALGQLVRLLDWDRGYGSNANYDSATAQALKAQWDLFLDAHRAGIEAGKRYLKDAPEMQALFPKTIWTFN